jgi:hypothetical protein
MATFAGGEIETFVGLPSSGHLTILNGSSSSSRVPGRPPTSQFRSWTPLPVAQALLDASWRGIHIRDVLEQDYLQDEKIPDRTPEAGETPHTSHR